MLTIFSLITKLKHKSIVNVKNFVRIFKKKSLRSNLVLVTFVMMSLFTMMMSFASLFAEMMITMMVITVMMSLIMFATFIVVSLEI